MGRGFTTVLALGAFSTLLLSVGALAQSKSKTPEQSSAKQPACCCQGMMGGMGMGPMRRRGMTMESGQGQGMQGRQSNMMGGMGEDMMTAHQLVMQHEKVKRTVKQLPNGVETVTESDVAAVAAKIKEHVPAMYRRLKENQPIRQFDPLFRELFRYGSKIDSKVTYTPNGVRVVETSTDPYVVKLIKAHAQTVDGLVKRGMEAMPEVHQPPNTNKEGENVNATDPPAYGISVVLGQSFEEAIARVREAFKEEGFGVLTEINVQQTLLEKIGLTMDPYTIIGMCNPNLASRSIAAEPNIGLFLPCNVLVAKRDEVVEVSAQDPLFMVPITGNDALQPIAQEARERIDRALARLKT